MVEYSSLTVEKFHTYLIGKDIRLRLSDMEEILKAAESEVEKEIKTGHLKKKSDPVLYQFAYEPAQRKLAEINEMRRLYAAAKSGEWNGVDRRNHSHPADN